MNEKQLVPQHPGDDGGSAGTREPGDASASPDVEQLIQNLKRGGLAPSHPGGGGHQFDIGTTGIWVDGDPLIVPGRGQLFVKQRTYSPHWREEWIILDLNAFVNVSPALRYKYLGTSTNPYDLIDTLKAGTEYHWATMLFDYLNMPSQSDINALPTNIFGQAYRVKNDGTQTGRMFREDLTGGGTTLTYRDHWTLWSTYTFPSSSGNMVTVETQTGSGTPTDLRTFMQAAYNDPSQYYVQVKYTVDKKTA